jgi:hypothetical protein
VKISGNTLWGALGITLLLAAGWTWWPVADAGDRLARLTLRGLLHDSRDLELTPEEREVFGAARVIKRLVRVRRVALVATVIDGTRDRHAVHDPLFCFRGAGWGVAEQSTVTLERGEARRVALRNGTQRAEALYWYSDGRYAHASALRYWWQSAWRRLTLGRGGAEPVLVILAVVGGSPPDWSAVLTDWPAVQNI